MLLFENANHNPRRRHKLKVLLVPGGVYWTLVQAAALDAGRLVPLELPGREAADVDVEPVETGLGTIVFELDLELQLVTSHGSPTDRALGSDTGTTPGPMRCVTR
jgi:hypothetical protein